MTNMDAGWEGRRNSELTRISSTSTVLAIATTHPAGSLEFFGLQNSPSHVARARAGPGSIFGLLKMEKGVLDILGMVSTVPGQNRDGHEKSLIHSLQILLVLTNELLVNPRNFLY